MWLTQRKYFQDVVEKNTQKPQDSNSLELDIFSTCSFISLWGRSVYYFSET